ncbi:MAG: hypothetical protein FWC79_04520 [Oscillospiraceae bacterium]|nr:hypothetical protein [Oscillospiraceae bacterium]
MKSKNWALVIMTTAISAIVVTVTTVFFWEMGVRRGYRIAEDELSDYFSIDCNGGANDGNDGANDTDD